MNSRNDDELERIRDEVQSDSTEEPLFLEVRFKGERVCHDRIKAVVTMVVTSEIHGDSVSVGGTVDLPEWLLRGFLNSASGQWDWAADVTADWLAMMSQRDWRWLSSSRVGENEWSIRLLELADPCSVEDLTLLAHAAGAVDVRISEVR